MSAYLASEEIIINYQSVELNSLKDNIERHAVLKRKYKGRYHGFMNEYDFVVVHP